MEIITYVRDGAITHEDSLGNKGRTEAGDVQVMSAGYRHPPRRVQRRKGNDAHLPDLDHSGRARRRSFVGRAPVSERRPLGPLVTLASGRDGDADALPIRANARVLGATVKAGETVEYTLDKGHHAYLVPAVGKIEVNGVTLDARDGAAIRDESKIAIKALADTEVVLVDVAA